MNKIIDTQLKSKFGRGGKTLPKLPGSIKSSTMHNTSSINNVPSISPLVPSNLDLNGKTPPRYLDNKPK